MLRFLLRLVPRKRLPSFERPDRRNIFQYWDGTRKRRGDPLDIQRKLDLHPEYRYDVHPALAQDGDPEAVEICLDAIQVAFDLPAFDEAQGLTIDEKVNLLVAFGRFIEAVKKNIWHLPTLRVPTDATSNESTEPTTSNSSGSQSSKTEPKSEKSTASDAESKSPLPRAKTLNPSRQPIS